MTTASPAATAAPPAAPRGEARRPDEASQRRHRDDFERALRERSATSDVEDELAGGEDELAAPPSAMAALFGPLAPLAAKRDRGDAGSVGAVEGCGGATRGAMQAALQAGPALPKAAELAAGTAWEVTLRDPMSVALDVKASKADAAHGWQLSIGSPVVDASILVRHAPKLNERLQARAAHARIAGSDPEEHA